MKTPILFLRPSILATGSALLAAGMVVLSPITAQDQPSNATPAAPPVAPAPALPSNPAVSVFPSAAAVPTPAPTPATERSLASLPVPGRPATSAPVKLSTGGGAVIDPSVPSAGSSGLPGTGSSDGREFATVEPIASTATPLRTRLESVAPAIAGSDVGPGVATIAVADLILTEEVSGNAGEMARHYEAVVADFDNRRANAAQAIFRLGENYRKSGRPDEARIQYARILREFVDFPELATLSQRQLTQGLPRQFAGGGGTTTAMGSLPATADIARDKSEWARATVRAAEEERTLLLQEIQLLESQVKQTEDLIASGQAPSTATMPLLREILQLKRQLIRTAASEAAPKVESTDHSEGGGGAASGEALFTSPAPEVPRAPEVPSR